MGYIRDELVQVAGAVDCLVSAGTWTDTLTGGVWSRRRSAAAAPFYLAFAGRLLQHGCLQRGSCLAGVDPFYKVGTSALNSLAAAVYLVTLPPDGSAFEDPVAQVFSYDTAHGTAGERVTVSEHRMTLTISTPFWVAHDELVQVELAKSAAAGSVFDWYGARFTITLRL